MLTTKRRYSVIAMLLIISCIWNDILHAAPIDVFTKRIRVHADSIDAQTVEPSAKTVILLKDAHTSFGIQKNIARIIDNLAQCGITHVGIEGASGILQTTAYRDTYPREIRDLVALEYLQKGEFSGGEYESIIANISLSMIGMETSELLKKNTEQFRSIISQSENTDKVVSDVSKIIARLKAQIYNPMLYQFDAQQESFDNESGNLVVYMNSLLQTADTLHIHTSQYPELRTLHALTLKTSLFDATSAYLQIDALYKEVRTLISQAAISHPSKEHMLNIIAHNRTTLSSEEFAEFLYLFAHTSQLNLANYAPLEHLIEHHRKYKNLNQMQVMQQIAALRSEIYTALLQKIDEQHLYAIDNQFKQWTTAMALRASRDEAHTLLEGLTDNTLEDCLQTLQQLAAQYNSSSVTALDIKELESLIRQSGQFYRTAFNREQELVDNVITYMNNNVLDSMILVAGGFHAQGITELLAKQNISCICVQPAVGKNDITVPHHEKIMGTLLNSTLTISMMYTDSTGSDFTMLRQFQEEVAQRAIQRIAASQTTVTDVVNEIIKELGDTSAQSMADVYKRLGSSLVDDQHAAIAIELSRRLSQHIAPKHAPIFRFMLNTTGSFFKITGIAMIATASIDALGKVFAWIAAFPSNWLDKIKETSEAVTAQISPQNREFAGLISDRVDLFTHDKTDFFFQLVYHHRTYDMNMILSISDQLGLYTAYSLFGFAAARLAKMATDLKLFNTAGYIWPLFIGMLVGGMSINIGEVSLTGFATNFIGIDNNAYNLADFGQRSAHFLFNISPYMLASSIIGIIVAPKSLKTMRRSLIVLKRRIISSSETFQTETTEPTATKPALTEPPVTPERLHRATARRLFEQSL